MSNQLIKKNHVEGYKNVFPKTFTDAIRDKESGVSLQEILRGFNMYFLSYNGNKSLTRCKVPSSLRKEGLWITYVLYDHTVVTEWYNSDNIDDDSWGNDSNWRVGNNALVGDVTISSDGYWVINGEKTESKAQGEHGLTPLIRFGENNKFQISYTEGKTWQDLSNSFTNNVRISKYIGINESLPTSGIDEGTIYMKGPYYDENDTNNDNPIYRMWVYAWKGNTLAWQDNGEFTSISAGVVQEKGTSTTEIMSQDAVTREINTLKENVDEKVAELELKQIYGIGISKSKVGESGGSIDIPFIYNVGDTLFWEVEDSIDRVSAISLYMSDGTYYQYGYANTGSIRLEEDGFSSIKAFAEENELANGRKLTIRIQPKEIVDSNINVESDMYGDKVGYTQGNLTDRARYSMTNGEYIDESARSYSFAIDSSIKRIVANFDHSHWNYGIILYKGESFVESYSAAESVIIDLTNKDVDRVIVQSYFEWLVSFAFYTKIGVKDRVADIASDITMIKGKEESYNESNLTLRARYSMTDGTLITKESQTHSGFFPIPENVNRIKVAYSPKNANRNWGVILYKGDTFVASYSDDVNFIDLANKDVDKVLIQTYYVVGVSISFIEKEGVVDNVERNTKDIQLLQSVSPQNVKINKIVATRNASDFNSIREIMANIQDASQSNQYVILIPKGRWFECDLVGKAYVSLVGESREETILYCDGLSNKVTPSDYSFPDYAGIALADIPSSQKHCIRATDNLDIKNCTIEATSCKYSIHLDHWLFTSVNIYNCIVNSINNLLYPIGIGIRGGQSIIVESSIIMYPEMTSSVGFVAHNMADQDEPSVLKFNKCYFKNCGFGIFSELGSKQEDIWHLDTCYSDGDKRIEFSESDGISSTPYNIKVNALGSNLAILKKRPSRPNAEQYVIANFDNIEIVA